MLFIRILSMTAILVLSSWSASAQAEHDLKSKLESLIAGVHADVGISIIETGSGNKLHINGEKRYPMMSTVKFPMALAVLSRVEIGEFQLDQQVYISAEALRENTYSPFKKIHPEGDLFISLEEALKWMVVDSDNNITDVLFNLLGGPKAVEQFIAHEGFVIRNNEDDMHKSWEAQFVNTAKPNAYAELLKSFSEGKWLNEEHTQWLYQAMVTSNTGTKRLKGKLPNVIIAQRAGTSFTEEGLTGVVNNVGIIELPDQQKIFIAVFIHNTTDGFDNAETLIADIAKATYEFYTEK
jgi:beta-lactamase class A